MGEETDSKWKCEWSMDDTGRPMAFRRDGDEGRKLMKFTVARESRKRKCQQDSVAVSRRGTSLWSKVDPTMSTN